MTEPCKPKGWWATLWGVPGAIWRAMIAAAPVQVWAQIGAGISLSLMMLGFGLIIWLGPWVPSQQPTQIEWLGRGMVLSGCLTMVALAAITGLSINFHGGKDGVSASIDRDEPEPIKVTTTTETTVTPGDDPAAFGGPRG